jgi:hypothetical protein
MARDDRPAPPVPAPEPAPPPKRPLAGAIAAAVLVSGGLTASFEGLRTKPYYDPAHIQTVCYGETERAMRNYTPAECLALLKDRQAADYAPAIAACVPGFAEEPAPLRLRGLDRRRLQCRDRRLLPLAHGARVQRRRLGATAAAVFGLVRDGADQREINAAARPAAPPRGRAGAVPEGRGMMLRYLIAMAVALVAPVAASAAIGDEPTPYLVDNNVIAKVECGKWVGTGVYVGNGLVATARHVVEDGHCTAGGVRPRWSRAR